MSYGFVSHGPKIQRFFPNIPQPAHALEHYEELQPLSGKLLLICMLKVPDKCENCVLKGMHVMNELEWRSTSSGVILPLGARDELRIWHVFATG